MSPDRANLPDIRFTDLATGHAARVVCGSAEGGAARRTGPALGGTGLSARRGGAHRGAGLMARAPIAVRIGTGTFALRLFEAACIRVCPEQPQPA
jgi:hypothetical protein